MSRFGQILDALESVHGAQAAQWPTDPYRFLVWWHCGYPPSEERCNRGWHSLNEEIGVSPEKLLQTPSSRLARILKTGGMVPELRAGRLKQIAERVQEQFAGDLCASLSRLPLNKVRTALKKFPGIGDPGADRIILFGGIAAVAAVPSSCPHVPVRIESGAPHEAYNANYREAREIMQREVAETFAARSRAYLLLHQHGQRVCKRSRPQCDACPLTKSCAFFQMTPGTSARTRKAYPS